jgi:tetratricopeptide (TPR) repeat protein
MNRWVLILVLAGFQFACTKSPQAYLERGNQFAAAGKYDDAELEYHKSILKDAQYAEAYYRLGLVEYHLRHGSEALQDFDRAVHFDPENDLYGIQFANVCIEAYQTLPAKKVLYDNAALEAQALLKKDPTSFDGLRLHGDVLAIDRKYDQALAEFQKANAIHADNPDVILAMTQILFAQGHQREGQELASRFIAGHKDFLPIYEILEAHYVRAKQLGDAERLLQLEITALPKNVRPRLQLADLYRATGRNTEMSQLLTQIVNDRADFPEGHAVVGDYYAQSKNWDDALTQYRAGIQSSSHKDLYHWKIEQALAVLGQREQALAELNDILKSKPHDFDARLSRAVMLRQADDARERDTAVQELKALAAEQPGNAVLLYNLGAAHWNKGDAASAWQELKTSSGLRKDYIAPRLLLADIAQTSHNYTAALQAADEALAIDPNDFDAKLLRASALVGMKSYKPAETELNALAKLQPDSKEVALQVAALAVEQKDYSKAEALYRRFYRPNPSDLRPLQGLLQLCVLQRHPEKGQALLQDDLKQEPESRPVHLLLASLATEEGKFDLASQQYRWLQSRDPKSVQPYLELGDLYQRQGANQQALASYEKARELSPNDPNILNAVAVVESNSGQERQAIAALKRQLELDPDNPTALNNLAFDLAETGTDLDRALTMAEKVARKVPNNPGVIDTLGWVYAKRGLNQSAVQVLRDLVKKFPNEPAYRYHLGVVLLNDKQSSDARREFLAALAQHPPKDLSRKIQENLAQVR